MPTPTYDLIASNVLSSSASSVTFSSIPATYRDLIIVVNANASGNGSLLARLNSDTGNTYHRVYMYGNGSTASSGSSSAENALVIGGGVYLTLANRLLATIQIMDYSATDKHKSILTRVNDSALGTDANALRWASTNAVSTILLYPDNARTFQSGSTFYLYGIA